MVQRVAKIKFVCKNDDPREVTCSIKKGISTEVEHFNVTTHTNKSKINTSIYTRLKSSKRETINDPSQCGYLRQYINAKSK